MRAEHYPLRRIVRTALDDAARARFGPTLWAVREELECGHLVRIRRDVYGWTFAARRRCRQCGPRSALHIAK